MTMFLTASAFLDGLTAVNDKINTFVWVTLGLVLLIGTVGLNSLALINHPHNHFPARKE